jgi:hypothetical protein
VQLRKLLPGMLFEEMERQVEETYNDERQNEYTDAFNLELERERQERNDYEV